MYMKKENREINEMTSLSFSLFSLNYYFFGKYKTNVKKIYKYFFDYYYFLIPVHSFKISRVNNTNKNK